MEKNDKYAEDGASDSDGSYESLEGKPEEYVKLIKEARPKFEAEEDNEFYSRGLILIGTPSILTPKGTS